MMTNYDCKLPKFYQVSMTDSNTCKVVIVKLNESTYIQYVKKLQEINDSRNNILCTKNPTLVFNKDKNNNTKISIEWKE
jgi:hypothetical protein